MRGARRNRWEEKRKRRRGPGAGRVNFTLTCWKHLSFARFGMPSQFGQDPSTGKRRREVMPYLADVRLVRSKSNKSLLTDAYVRTSRHRIGSLGRRGT